MRKKFFNGKRVLALALALSMVVSEAAFAAPADVAEEAIEEVVEAESVSVNEAVSEATEVAPAEEADEVDEAEAEVTEEAVEEAAEETEEEDVEAETAMNGTPSKVIGLKGQGSFYTITDDAGTVVKTYSDVVSSENKITVPGKFEHCSEPGLSDLYFINGKYYTYVDYNEALKVTTINPKDEAVLADTTYSSETDLYSVNGAFYENGSPKYYEPSSAVVPVIGVQRNENESMDHALNRLYGQYAKSDTWYKNQYSWSTYYQDKYNRDPDYYEFNGKCYKDIVTWGNVPYFRASEEIAIGAQKVSFNWNPVTIETENKLDAQGNPIQIGYEVMINDMPYEVGSTVAYGTDNSWHYLQQWTGVTTPGIVAPGASVTAKVRAVYYVWTNDVYTNTDGKPEGEDNAHVVSVGPWSEPCTYTLAAKTKVPAVASVSAHLISNTNEVKLDWSAVPQAVRYEVYVIDSKKDLGMTAQNFGKWYNGDSDLREATGVSWGDYITNCIDEFDEDDDEYDPIISTGLQRWVATNYQFHYYAVVPVGAGDYTLYFNDNTVRNIAAFASVVTADSTVDFAPVVTGLKVEQRSDGELYLCWDEINQDVAVYAYDSATFPAWYNVNEMNPNRKATVQVADGDRYYVDGSASYEQNGNMYWAEDEWVYGPATIFMGTSYLTEEMSQKDKNALAKVQVSTTKGRYGQMSLTSNFNMIPGKKYYFVMHSYDDTNYYKEKAAPITYAIEKVSYDENHVKSVTAEPTAYTYYKAMSAPSAVVSATRTMGAPYVSTAVTKDSVKLTMTSGYETGYEIYRKSGKKYKKIATITDDVYTDANLKVNTQYSYKVRGYYYNPDTKTKYYSKYSVVDVKTADAANIQVSVTEKSTTSVKVSWTKVSGATKYEVYRTNSSNCDPKVVSKKFAEKTWNSNVRSSLSNARYELVKSVAKGTSFTDKKLTAGESYTYVVMAYKKVGKTTEYVTDSDYVNLTLNTPTNIKTKTSGNKVKVTWDVDKYAAKFEIKYTVFDKNGNAKTDTPVKASTKKNSYTISNVNSGEWVSVSVRAYGKDKTFSSWSDVSDSGKSLAVVKGVKATPVTKKLASGTSVDGIKISWKKVSGAKYYRVFRSTTEATYDADDKVYDGEHGIDISKEANDDFRYYPQSSYDIGYKTWFSDVYYDMYMGVEGSITGTSAIDYSTDLKKGVNYYYTVVAYGDISSATAGSYVSSIGTIKAVKVTFGADVALTLKNAKAGKVTVSYKKVPGAKKYLIMRADKKNGTFKQIGSTKKTSFTDTKAKKGKTYYYKVVATGTNALKADMNAESPVKSIKVKK